MRRSPLCRALKLFCLVAVCSPVQAQYLDTYLPVTVPGFDQTMGVTVLTRPRPLYRDEGVQLGAFTVRGGLDEKFGYDSNIVGTPRGIASPYVETNPTVTADSNWSRNRLGVAVGLDRFDYLSNARQSHTDANVAVGGGWTILRNLLDVGYAHIHSHEFGIESGAVAFDTPLPYDVDIVRGAYTWDQGRVQLTPNFDFRRYQYGNGTVGGVTVPQRYRDRTVASGGVTGRWMLSDERALVLVLQGAGSSYLHQTLGAPSNNSQSVLVLPGIDYQASGPWRYRLLFGGEVRTFDAAQYGTRVSPVFEGSVIYMPTELTTVTATVRRAIEDPQAEGTSGYTYTGLGLVIDHELRRNVLLQASGAFKAVDYFQGLGSTHAYSFGAGANWLLSPHMSAFATYHFTRQDASGSRTIASATQPATTVLPSFTQNIGLIGLRWRL